MENYIHKVNYYETDKMQIVHHSNYIRFMEEARVDFLEKIGWSFDKLEAEGIASPVVSVSCDYRRPTRFADKIEIEVSVAECTSVKLKIAYKMTVGEEIVCTGTSLHCFVEANGRPLIIQRDLADFYKALMDTSVQKM